MAGDTQRKHILTQTLDARVNHYRQRYNQGHVDSVSECDKVFVYGTLLHGFRNHFFLFGCPRVASGKTQEPFAMYAFTYPWLVRDSEHKTQIVGEVYQVAPDVLSGLDALEGYPDLYTREIITVDTEAGPIRAWVYLAANPNTRHATLVTSGNYAEFSKRHGKND